MPTGWDRQVLSRNKDSKNILRDVIDHNESSHPKISNNNELNRLENFIPEEPHRTLSDLVVSPSVRARIETAINRIRYHDVLYNKWNLKKVDPNGDRVVINLFGPPGTGKTFCAEAISHHLGRKIIKINYAEIESKYVGETPKNITAAFEKAKSTKSILFFDEADSILGKRLTNITQSADHSVNVSRSVMLLQLDKFDGIVIFATNLAKNYDSAFVRRILSHIEFELPDEDCRLRLWKYLLPVEIPLNKGITLDWLAKVSEGLTGGDIINVVISSASRAVVRTGRNQQIVRTDILEEIENIHISKQKISSSYESKKPITVHEEILSPEELPLEIKNSYNANVDNQRKIK